MFLSFCPALVGTADKADDWQLEKKDAGEIISATHTNSQMTALAVKALFEKNPEEIKERGKIKRTNCQEY